MGHGANDKLFITPSEYSGVYGQHGATKGAQREKPVIVPFHMCAITYQPWTQPACLVRDGLVCDKDCLLYTSPSPRDVEESRMPSSA